MVTDASQSRNRVVAAAGVARHSGAGDRERLLDLGAHSVSQAACLINHAAHPVTQAAPPVTQAVRAASVPRHSSLSRTAFTRGRKKRRGKNIVLLEIEIMRGATCPIVRVY